MTEVCNKCEYKEICDFLDAEDTDSCEAYYGFSANEIEEGEG